MYRYDEINKSHPLNPLHPSHPSHRRENKYPNPTCHTRNPKQKLFISSKRPSKYFRIENILLPCLEALVPYLTLKEVNALGLANQAWRKRILTDSTNKQPYIDRKRSLLVYLYVQHLLRNSETNPMTSTRLLELTKKGRLLNCTILPFLCTHHFALRQEDYMTNVRLYTAIKHGPLWHRYVQIAVTRFSVPVLSHYEADIERQIEGHGLSQLRNFSALHTLTLQGPFKDAELGLLICLAGTLQRLSILSSLITDVGLKTLAQLSALKKLTLCTPNITNGGLHALEQLTQLQSLRFAQCHHITTMQLAQVTGLLALQSLSFVECGLHGIQGLESFTTLRSLTLRNCFRIMDDHIDALSSLKLLQHLNLSVCKEVTGLGLARLSGHPALQSLILDYTNVDEGCLFELWKDHFPALKAVSRRRPYYPILLQPPSDITYVVDGLYIKEKSPVDEKTIKLWKEYFLAIDRDHVCLINAL